MRKLFHLDVLFFIAGALSVIIAGIELYTGMVEGITIDWMLLFSGFMFVVMGVLLRNIRVSKENRKKKR